MSQASTHPVQRKQRRIQSKQDSQDRAQGSPEPSKEPVQTSARQQPGEHPAQHIEKPGLEAELQEKPRFEAPDYKGSGKLDGFSALITGGDSGIGRAVAV